MSADDNANQRAGAGDLAHAGRPAHAATVFELELTKVAHGGYCVGRHDGQVVFVRHGLPGERVLVRITERSKRFVRADVIEVLDASPHRVTPPCPVARPGGCGGCDWQHATLAHQRDLKAAVVAEQLSRLAGIERDVTVEALPGDGFGWRTRVRFAVDDAGHVGFRQHRSHEVVRIDDCPIAHVGIDVPGIAAKSWNRAIEVEVATSAVTGERVLRTTARRDGSVRTHGAAELYEQVRGRSFRVSAGGFWQVHPDAAEVLTQAVLDAVRPAAGETALDLYAGAGVFAAALADAVGPSGRVLAVESATLAAADARTNLRAFAHAQVVNGHVTQVLRQGLDAADVVVLDPPRAGAGEKVVQALVALRPRTIAYVACDPAALARDAATFRRAGYSLTHLRAFDLFPQTHHVECVATFEPAITGEWEDQRP